MPYYLKHHFDPYFDYTKLKPKELDDGSVDYYNLGYVQNVVKNQVLAEWKEISQKELANYDSSFIYQKKQFPIGPNCMVNPDNPDQLLAAENGYVFYYQGKIAVKKVLNVRGNLDFYTGNVYFVNDIIVHQDIKSGFEVWAHNIRVNGVVEAAKLTAGNSILIAGGVKGESQAIIQAEKDIKANFCEKATLVSKGNIIIEKACLNCNTFSGPYLAVKNKIVGGRHFCRNKIYIGGDLGGGMNTKTRVILGYSPGLMFKIRELENKSLELQKEIEWLKLKGQDEDENQEAIVTKEELLSKIKNKLQQSWEMVNREDLTACRIMVKGQVHPGVEISIGQHLLTIDDYLEDVRFFVDNDEIQFASPALRE